MRVITISAVVAVTALTAAGLGVGSAMADPYATPASTSIVGVGSDTTTPLFDGDVSVKDTGTFVTDYNAGSPSNLLWSYDATGSSTITPKPGCTSITRPDGSSAGISQLNLLAKDSSGNYCVDFARSSRAPKAVSGNGPDAFVAFAKDAITWASPSGSGSPVPATLTQAQLTAIYNCTDTNWDQVGGSNATIVPVLPQSNSGTRSTFLAALGGGVNNPLVPGSCVTYNGTDPNDSNALIEENTGTSSSSYANSTLFAQSNAVDMIFPYSVGDYIAQGSSEGTYNGKAIGGHTSSDFAHGTLVLKEVSGVSPTTTDNTSPYSGATVINTGSFDSSLQRLLYNVVINGGTATAPAFPTTPAYEKTALPAIFGSSGWICTNTTAQTDIASYGFFTLGRSCGALSAGS